MHKQALRQNEGFTILEMMIAVAITGIVVGVSLLALTNVHDAAGLNTVYWQYEARLQEALDDVNFYLQESRPSLVDFYTYNRDGLEHTAISFPSPRDRYGNYVLQDADGSVYATPLWQAVVVYAYADDCIRRYMDFSVHSYSGPISILDITETEIRLSDGTRFNLDGTPQNGNQKIFTLLDDARRFVAENTTPIHLTVEAQFAVEKPPAQTFIITLDTGILARNNN